MSKRIANNLHFVQSGNFSTIPKRKICPLRCNPDTEHASNSVKFRTWDNLVNEDDVVEIVRTYIEGLFPRDCSQCGLRFGSLREYLQLTRYVGRPISYDAMQDEIPSELLGT